MENGRTKELKNGRTKERKNGFRFFSFSVLTFFSFSVITFFSFAYAENFTYSSKGRRDPFVPLVGAGAVYQVKEAVDIGSVEDVVLEGIVYDAKGSSIAIINGVVVKEGHQIGIVIVDKIEPKKVILCIEDNRYEVSLGKEEGGEGK